MAQANPWSQMKNASAAPTDEELFQQLINAGALPKAPGQPMAPAPAARAVRAAVKKSAPAAPSAPVQQAQPDPRAASAGTYRLPYEDNISEDMLRDIALKNRVMFQSPEELAARYKGIEAEIPAVAGLKKGNQDYRDLIAMEAARGGQTDLSGLMTLADVASNNRFGLRAGYKAPGDKAKELLANMDKAQDNESALMKDVIAMANSGKAGYDTSTLTQQLLEKIAQGVKTAPPRSMGGGNPINNYDKWVNQTNKAFKKVDDTADQINLIKTEVASGNPIDDSRIAILRATMDAHGRPNMAEVQMESGNRALLAKIPQAWERLATGKMTEANRELYMESFNTVLEYLNLERQATAKRLKSMAKNYGVNESAANDRLPKEYVDKAHVKESDKPAAPKSARERELQTLDQQNKEILEFIRAQKGGQ